MANKKTKTPKKKKSYFFFFNKTKITRKKNKSLKKERSVYQLIGGDKNCLGVVCPLSLGIGYGLASFLLLFLFFFFYYRYFYQRGNYLQLCDNLRENIFN
jgi:hypothetical protein